jgi:hypothetical protein
MSLLIKGAVYMPWKFLARGGYSKVYHDEAKGLVLKIQILTHDETDAYDTPSRSVQLWNELSPHLGVAPARLVVHKKTKEVKGWSAPYIEGRQSTDKEISELLVRIYNLTGRIVMDANMVGNCLTTPEGKVVCVDVGLMLRLERRSDDRLSGGRARRKSEVSLQAWKRQGRDTLASLKHDHSGYPLTALTIQALVNLQREHPDLDNVDFLLGNLPLLTTLAASNKGIPLELLRPPLAADEDKTPTPVTSSVTTVGMFAPKLFNPLIGSPVAELAFCTHATMGMV